MARDFVPNDALSNAAAVLTATPITMACWVWTDQVTDGAAFMSLANGGTVDDYFFLGFYGHIGGDPITANTRQGANNYDAMTSTGMSVNTWHHACAVFASPTSRASYIDGGSKGTNASSSTPVGISRTAIGLIWDSSPAYFHDGRIAEAAIWNAALTDAEVAILGKGYSPLFVRPQSLVAYWPLIGRTNPEIDIIGTYPMTENPAPNVAAHPPIMRPNGYRLIKYPSRTSSASGPTLAAFVPVDGIVTTANYATMGARNGHRVLNFDDTSNEFIVFSSNMPSNYSGNGIAVHIYASAASATSGIVRWGASVERVTNEIIDIDGDSFSPSNNVHAIDVPATSGQLQKFSIFFENGADMDSVVAGDQFRLKIFRDAVSDTATGDAEIHNVEVQEVS